VADLALTLSVDQNSVTVGSDVTYTVTVVDNGPADATDVRVNLSLATGEVFQNVSSDGAYVSVNANNVVVTKIGTVGVGTVRHVNVTAQVQATGVLTSIASASTSTNGSQETNSVSQDILGVAPAATPTPTPSPTPRTIANISTRLQVGTGDNVLIAGFIINGTTPKKILIRASGPSLAGSGVQNPLSDPELELHDTSSVIARNQDWQTTEIGGLLTADQVQEITNSGLQPSASAEPALIVTLNPGTYTAIVQDENSGTGVGTVEVYDLSTDGDARLVNISTRGFVQTGDNVMIGGFITVNQPTTLFIRARGPSLSNAGITNPLEDPQLELHDATSIVATNDDWQTTQIGSLITNGQASVIQNSPLKPDDAKEPAMIVTLPPGIYTAIIRGANESTGVATVEAYVLE
jgi:uncharacterized repeat protein (TIGR01451 family)